MTTAGLRRPLNCHRAAFWGTRCASFFGFISGRTASAVALAALKFSISEVLGQRLEVRDEVLAPARERRQLDASCH